MPDVVTDERIEDLRREARAWSSGGYVSVPAWELADIIDRFRERGASQDKLLTRCMALEDCIKWLGRH